MPARGPDYELNALRRFLDTLMWVPQEEYLDAITLILAVSHAMDVFTAVPYVLVTSDLPKVGKSTLSRDVPLLFASRPWRVSRNTTTEALRNKFTDREKPDSILLDDASKVFGESGTRAMTTPLYQLGVDGYVKNATVSVSRNGSSVDLPAFVMFWMNGLRNAVPGDLATRAIQFKMTPKPRKVRKRDAMSAGVAKEAAPLKLALHRWAASHKDGMRRFTDNDVLYVHPLLTDRLLQIWGPVFAVAHEAGGQWPRKALDAFLAMALDEGGKPVLLAEDQVLADTAKILMQHGTDRIFTADLVSELRETGNELYEGMDTQYLVEDLLPRALGPSSPMRGRNLAGKYVTSTGRLAAPVLEAAAQLREDLTPEPVAVPQTAVQRELEMTEVRR
jgi:Protein of unknown function (DUF3631)